MTQDAKRLTEAELLHSRAGSDCGRGKIRYIGGWAIMATLMYRKRQKVKRHL